MPRDLYGIAPTEIGTEELVDGAVTARKAGTWPAASGISSSSATYASGSVHVIPLITEDFDTEDLHDLTVNPSRLTIVTAGVYVIDAVVSFGNNATGVRFGYIRHNGNYIRTNGAVALPVSYATPIFISAIKKLNVGDYIEVAAWQNSTVALGITAELGVHWLGKG